MSTLSARPPNPATSPAAAATTRPEALFPGFCQPVQAEITPATPPVSLARVPILPLYSFPHPIHPPHKIW